MNDNEPIVWLAPDDPRLPVKLDRQLPSMDFLLSCKSGIFQNILLVQNIDTGEIWLAFGRARILAARYWATQGVPILIPTRITNGTEADAYYFALMENGQRSDNGLSDYLALCYFQRQGKSNREIAKLIGVSLQHINKIEKKLHGCPSWAVELALEDKIRMSLLPDIAKCTDEQQTELYNDFIRDGKLVADTVKSVRRIATTANYQYSVENMFSTQRDTFTWDELEPILSMNTIEEARGYLEGLRNGTV